MDEIAMTRELTIGKLAKLCGVPTSTLRYYERAGLLEPIGRTESNYRFYGDSSKQRIEFIRAAQAAGFSITDIAKLLDAAASDATCGIVERLIEDRLRDVQRRLEDLQAFEYRLQQHLDTCRKTENKGQCDVLQSLSQTATGR